MPTELKSKMLWFVAGLAAMATVLSALLLKRHSPPLPPFVRPKEVPSDIEKVKKELRDRGLIK